MPYFKGGKKDRDRINFHSLKKNPIPFNSILPVDGVSVDMIVLGAVAAATVDVSGRSKPHQQMKTRDRKLSK